MDRIPRDTRVAIAALQVHCKTVIDQINRCQGSRTPGFQTINELLRKCDAVFITVERQIPDLDTVAAWLAAAERQGLSPAEAVLAGLKGEEN